MVSFGQALTRTDITEFSNFLLQLKNQKFGSKSVWLFYDFDFKNNYGVLKSKSPCFLLDKNVNFHRNATESKMENPKETFRDRKLVLKLESQI